MISLVSTIVTGFTSFVITNIDGIFILTALFSESTSTKRKGYIVAGQYLGMLIIMALSFVGSLGSLLVPKAWIGFLGVIPVYMGVKMFLSRDENQHDYRNVLTDPNTYKVMAVVIGNGADNISVYIPLFMQGHWFHKGLIAAVFLILSGVWCWIAYKVVQTPWIGRYIERYGQKVIPIFLVGLGGYIMWQTGAFALLTKLVLRW